MTNPPAADEPAAAKAEDQEPEGVRPEPSFTADYLPEGEPAATERTDESETVPVGATTTSEAGGPPFAAPPPGGYQPGGYQPGGYQPGGYQPGGYPPPFAAGFNRAGLVRPAQGRYIAGVCAAIGRATNTDPTLWRVIFAVLTLAGGISIVAYLLGWLLLPSEGDSASPLEALFGRGRSTTSAPASIVIGLGALLAFLLVMTHNVGSAAVGLAVVIGVVALLVRGQGDRQPASAGQYGGPYLPPPAPYPPQAPPTAMFAQPTQTMPAPAMPFPAASSPTMPSPTMPWSGTATAAMPAAGPPAPPVFMPVTPPAPPGYRPPFAPHGPYAARSPYAATIGYPPPGAGPAAYPGLAPMPPAPPKPPKERSKLGRVTFSLMCLAVGVLVALEVTVADFKTSTFFALPLAIVAAGLIIGAWFGRARLLILLGAVLSMALLVAAVSTDEDGRLPQRVNTMSINPASVAELHSSYSTDIGDIHADLTGADFVDHDVELTLRVGVAGDVQVNLPPDVDVTVDVKIQGGDCQVFDHDCSGLNQSEHYVDNGTDGAGGGKLHLNVIMQYGDLEVNR